MKKIGSPEKEMSFLDHLEELRWHLIRSTLAVVIIACLAFIFKGFIFDTILFGPKNMDFPTYKFFCNIATFFGVNSEFCGDSLPITIQSRSFVSVDICWYKSMCVPITA